MIGGIKGAKLPPELKHKVLCHVTFQRSRHNGERQGEMPAPELNREKYCTFDLVYISLRNNTCLH